MQQALLPGLSNIELQDHRPEVVATMSTVEDDRLNNRVFQLCHTVHDCMTTVFHIERQTLAQARERQKQFTIGGIHLGVSLALQELAGLALSAKELYAAFKHRPIDVEGERGRAQLVAHMCMDAIDRLSTFESTVPRMCTGQGIPMKRATAETFEVNRLAVYFDYHPRLRSEPLETEQLAHHYTKLLDFQMV